VPASLQRLAETIDSKRIRCERGIDQYLGRGSISDPPAGRRGGWSENHSLLMKRLLKSLAWRFLPHAGLEAETPGALRLPIRDSGAWGCLSEIFVQRTYEPFWPYLRDVRGWVDLGCNVGFFSLGLLDFLSPDPARRPATKALLGDANQRCLQTAAKRWP